VLPQVSAVWTWSLAVRQHIRRLGTQYKKLLIKGLLIGLAATVLVWQGYGFRLMAVQSTSMQPTIHKGDIVLTRNTSVYQTRVGDIVSYARRDSPSVVVTHRVTSVDPIQGTIVTKGDANATTDRSIEGNAQLRGRMVTAFPGLGDVSNVLHSWLGLTLAVYLPMLLLVVHELLRLVRHYQRPTYRLQGRIRF
jgi:signal peptidase I